MGEFGLDSLGLLDELATPHDLWFCPDVAIGAPVWRDECGAGQLAPLGFHATAGLLSCA